MSSKKLWLTGIGSMIPYAIVLYTIVFLIATTGNNNSFVPQESLSDPHSIWVILYVILIGLWLISTAALTVYYLFDIFNNENVPKERRVFWLLMIILLNSLSFIAYWIAHIYSRESRRNENNNSYEKTLEHWKLITAANSDVGRNIRIKLWVTGIGSCFPFATLHLLLFALAFGSMTDRWLSEITQVPPYLEALPIVWFAFYLFDLFFLKFYFLYDLAFFRDKLDINKKVAWGLGLLMAGVIVLPSYWYNVVYKRLTIDQDNY